MKTPLALAAVLAVLAAPAARAGEPARPFELTPFAGAFIPLLNQRGDLGSAPLLGLRGTYDLHRNVALVLAGAWARPETGARKVDLFQWDIGLQGQSPIALAGAWSLEPFAGVGIGTRTYSLVDAGVGSQTDFVFYSALGADLRRGPFAVGATARHQLTAFTPAGDSGARGDLALLGSVSWRL
jgi:hypothetical protein